MRTIAWALLIGAVFAGTAVVKPDEHVVEASTVGQLVELLRKPLYDTTIRLQSTVYRIPVTESTERIPGSSTVGNRVLTKPRNSPPDSTNVSIKVGLTVSGRNVRIVGAPDGGSRIVTDAAYKIYFLNCADCELDRVTIMDVADERARWRHNGAVVAANSKLKITNCFIRGDSLPGVHGGPVAVEGENGIYARAGAELLIEFNEIRSNAFAIQLEDAEATIRHNLISGINPPSERCIGVLVDGYMNSGSKALMEANHFLGCMTGIRAQGKADLSCKANIIEQTLTDGLVAGDQNLGRVRIEDNVFFRCGRSAIYLRAEGDQLATRNIIVESGTIQPRESAVCVQGARADAAVRKNTLYSNAVTDKKLDIDVSREAFWRARRPWTRTYRNTPVGVDGRHKFYESAFLTRYGRWSN